MHSELYGFVQTTNQRGNHRNETFASSLNETIEALMAQVASKAGKQPATMPKDEKVHLVQSRNFMAPFSSGRPYSLSQRSWASQNLRSTTI